MRAFLSAVIVILIATVIPVHGGDRVIARVGNEAVTSRELSDALARNPEFSRNTALDLLMERRLVLVWADGRKISIADEEVDQAVSSIRQRNNFTEAQFETALESQGETPESFRASLLEQLIINKAIGVALAGKVQVSDDELEKLYKETYQSSVNYAVSHILLLLDRDVPAEKESETLVKARQILKEIKGGSSFEGMALKYSQDTTTSEDGGRLGTFSEGELLPELEELAQDLEPGEVGGPVRTAAGYHILLLESRDLTDPPPLAEVRVSLERSLMAQKEESARTEWLKELRETTYTEVFPDDG